MCPFLFLIVSTLHLHLAAPRCPLPSCFLSLLQATMPMTWRRRSSCTSCGAMPTGWPRTEAWAPRARGTRPLQLASQKEVVLYAHFCRLDYFLDECVYAPEAFRGHARDLLKLLEAARPSAVLGLVHSAERLVLAPAALLLPSPPPRAWSRCGALASRALCQACALLDGLDRGKGRWGQDEVGDDAGARAGPNPVPEAVPTF